MAIDVRPVCPTGEDCVPELEQTIDMVLDLERSERPRGMVHEQECYFLRVMLNSTRKSNSPTIVR